MTLPTSRLIRPSAACALSTSGAPAAPRSAASFVGFATRRRVRSRVAAQRQQHLAERERARIAAAGLQLMQPFDLLHDRRDHRQRRGGIAARL